MICFISTSIYRFSAQYRLEIQDGKVIWFHRDSQGITLFSATTDAPVLTSNVWSHILVTYTVATGTAQIFINGELKKEEIKDAGQFLSTDWDKYAGKEMSLTILHEDPFSLSYHTFVTRPETMNDENIIRAKGFKFVGKLVVLV